MFITKVFEEERMGQQFSHPQRKENEKEKSI